MGADSAWTMPVWIGGADPNYHSRRDCESANLADGRQTTVQEAVAIGRRKCEFCWQEATWKKRKSSAKIFTAAKNGGGECLRKTE